MIMDEDRYEDIDEEGIRNYLILVFFVKKKEVENMIK
jgi:hypothetical protein